jgi:ribonuclease HI
MTITKKVVTTPKVTEVMAALEAILFCKNAGFFTVLLEGDAKQMVNEVNNSFLNLSTAGHFIEGIILEMQWLKYESMVYVGREANNVTRCLANEAFSMAVDSVWLEDIPRCILHALLRDVLVPRSIF